MSSAGTSPHAERVAALAFDPGDEPQEVVTTCNLCGSSQQVEAARTDRYGYPVRMMVCGACGLGCLSPRLTAEAYATFYREVYRPLVSAYHGYRIDAQTVQEQQREYAAELVAWAATALPERVGSVIDIGGSTGVVARAVAERFGGRATVLDPAPDELEVARAAGMETITGFVEDFDPAGRVWQLVMLCQTVDHLLDVRATLGAMRGMVAPDGHVFVDVLDVTFMLARLGSIEGAVKIDHPYYLTRTTGLAFLRQSGFTVIAERMSDDGHWGFLARPCEPAEPDAAALRAHADALLEDIWTARARG